MSKLHKPGSRKIRVLLVDNNGYDLVMTYFFLKGIDSDLDIDVTNSPQRAMK